MTKGTYVRHRARPEWGFGRVREDSDGERCTIDFEHKGPITLDLRVARHNLEIVDAADVPTHHATHQLKREGGARQHAARCAHCTKPLNRSIYSANKTLKSCPRCSAAHGAEHVFYDYPDGFGTSDARISEDTPDGAQSYCKTCRPKMRQTPTALARRCSDVMPRH